MRQLDTIFGFIILPTIFACSYPQISDKEVEAKAVVITAKLDSQSIKTLYDWGFGHRGNAEIFSKHSDSSDIGFLSYCCFYFAAADSIKLSVFRIENFEKEFPFSVKIDTATFSMIDFIKQKDASVRISAVDKQGQNQVIAESIPLRTLFTGSDPFEKFNYLFNFKKSLGIIGNYYRPDIGNFIQVYLTNQHVLTYFPDSLQIHPKFRDVLMGYFSTGKTLSKNWNFRKLESPLDNG